MIRNDTPCLTLLLGPAGCGKTHSSIEAFETALKSATHPLNEDLLFILPTAEHRERTIDLVLRHGLPGFFHKRITTFDRALKEFLKLGGIDFATDVTRRIILKGILQHLDLDYFRDAADTAGFLELMGRTIVELKEYLVQPDELERRFGSLEKRFPEFAPKYDDLSRIYNAYEDELKRRNLTDQRDSLRLLEEGLKRGEFQSPRLRGVWMDGFSDFSKLQLAFIEFLARHADEMTVTLTLDQDPLRRPLFQVVSETLFALEDIGFKKKWMDERNYRTANENLQRLEENLFRDTTAIARPEGEATDAAPSLRGINPETVIARQQTEAAPTCPPVVWQKQSRNRHCEASDPSIGRSNLASEITSSMPGTLPRNDGGGIAEPVPSPRDCCLAMTGEGSLGAHPRNDSAVTPSIHVFEATGSLGEIEMIAREIKRLVRAHSYHFSDIAVLFRTTDPYIQVIRSVFRKYQIPVEIHERMRLRTSPIARTLASFFEIILNDWTRKDLFNFLKSSYVRPYNRHSESRLRRDEESRSGSFGEKRLRMTSEGSLMMTDGERVQYELIVALELMALQKGVFKDRSYWLASFPEAEAFKDIAHFEDQFLRLETVDHFAVWVQHVMNHFGLLEFADSLDARTRRDREAARRILLLLEEMKAKRRGAIYDARGLTEEEGAMNRAPTIGTPHPRNNEAIAFAKAFLALMEVDLYSVHSRDKNKVQVYNVSLARQKEYQVVFLAGLLEKQFPIQIKEDPILSDAERRALNEGGEVLKERLPRQAFERYLFYLAVTRAREHLILSYPRFDLEGKEALPSFYVEEVRRLFEGRLPEKKQHVADVLPPWNEVATIEEAEQRVVKDIWSMPEGKRNRADLRLAFALYNHVTGNTDFKALVSRLFQPIEGVIADERIRPYFVPAKGVWSPTMLEEYAECPYRFFSHRLLGLESQTEGIDLRRRGTILHDVLQAFFTWRRDRKRCIPLDTVIPTSLRGSEPEHGRSNLRSEIASSSPGSHPRNDGCMKWDAPDRKEQIDFEEAKDFCMKKFKELWEEKPLTGDRYYKIELERKRMQEMILDILRVELIEGKAPIAGLTPTYFEYEFQDLVLKGERREILLRGKIDRIDVDPGGKFGLVIDYKTGKAFKLRALENGTSLQLPLYIIAVREKLGLELLGGHLYLLARASSSGFHHKDHLAQAALSTKKRNHLSEKEFEELIDRSVRFAEKFVDGIERAGIPVRPRDCVSYCPYSSLCRIEKWRLKHIYREITEEDKRFLRRADFGVSDKEVRHSETAFQSKVEES
ncbi:MAG: hypothetical protein A3G87_08910 [Omnitrophica bacterium RIFCSPLOWO2_12_FULL_50_11]|nr:MAG: hypothetical protein A3G87_08910 [Omnitrophica bacterium RIFCSPLOWO2_12_FULL_50_11]